MAVVNIKQLREAKDDIYQQTIQVLIIDSKPNRTTKLYKGIWDHLATRNGLLIFDNSRLVIPPSLIKPILKGLHQSHNGITKTTALARELYYWPGMNNNIKQKIRSCRSCQTLLPLPPCLAQTRKPSDISAAPMSNVATDLALTHVQSRER